MSKYYNKEDFTKYATQQIIENQDLIKALEIVNTVLPKFDGKVINKRLKTAIEAELDKSFKSSYFNCELLNNYARLNVTVRDNDTYHDRIDNYGYASTNYVNYSTTVYLDWNNDNRMESAQTIEKVSERIVTINSECDQLNSEIQNITEIEKEFNAIKQSIEQFNNKHSSELLELYSFRR